MFDRTMPFAPVSSRLDLELDLDRPHAPAAMSGLPQDRAARIAARRAFVEMKQLFLSAVHDLDHHQARWLRCRIRAAGDPADLMHLRGPLLDALHEDETLRKTRRAELYRDLGGAFLDSPDGPGRSSEDLSSLPDAWQIWSGDARPALRLGR